MAITINGTTGLAGVDGSASTPAVQGADTNTGMFFPAADTIAFAEGGAEVARFDSSGNLGIGTSSPGYKVDTTVNSNSLNGYNVFGGQGGASEQIGYRALNANSTGLFAGVNGFNYSGSFGPANQAVLTSIGNVALLLGTNNTERARIDSSGNVLIGDTSTAGTGLTLGNGKDLYLKATGYNTWKQVNYQGGLYWNNGSDRVVINSSGNLLVPGIYNLTTSAGANVHVASDGTLYRSTSSLKYKTDVKDATHGLAQVMQLRSVTYKGNNDGDVVFGGLIAEEVHEAGLTEFVQYAEDGTPDALAYANMVSLAFKAIQEQQALINDLTARIAALEAA